MDRSNPTWTDQRLHAHALRVTERLDRMDARIDSTERRLEDWRRRQERENDEAKWKEADARFERNARIIRLEVYALWAMALALPVVTILTRH